MEKREGDAAPIVSLRDYKAQRMHTRLYPYSRSGQVDFFGPVPADTTHSNNVVAFPNRLGSPEATE